MELLKAENVRIEETASDWKDAIRMAVKPLEGEYVTANYKEEIISNIEKMGPYIILMPGVALPHAGSEQGVKKSQMAVTLFSSGIPFPGKKEPVRLFITLAAADGTSHLEALRTVSEILQDEEKVDKIFRSATRGQLYQHFQ